MRAIVVATGNRCKLREIRELLVDLPVSLSFLADHFDPMPDIPETGATFFENALQKAQWVSQRLENTWVLSDDSGLEVDALGGRPGVRSARFAGDNATTAENNRLLLSLLATAPLSSRTARFRCVVVLVTEASKYFSTQGTCEGKIAPGPRGAEGFGYDPLFIPAGFSQTFAEMVSAEKNPISHRGRALVEMKKHLNDLLGVTHPGAGTDRREVPMGGTPREVSSEKNKYS